MKEHLPVFDHDCDQCIFLENFQGADLYFCPSTFFGGSLIARDGDEGSQYASCPKDVFDSIRDQSNYDPRILRVAEILKERNITVPVPQSSAYQEKK